MTEKTFTKSDTKVIKALAVLLMLIHHLFAFPDRISNDHTALFSIGGVATVDYLGCFGKICVALFLFLGGLGSYYSYRNHIKAKKKRELFVFVKIRALYTAYWRVFAIALPISLLLGTAYGGNVHLANIIYDFFGITHKLCGEWWFLALYVMYTIAMPCLYKLSRRSKNRISDIKTIALLYVAAFFVWPAINSLSVFDPVRAGWIYTQINDFIVWLPCFYIGLIFAKRNVLGKAKARCGGNYLTCLLFLLGTCVLIIARRRMGIGFDCLIAPVFAIFMTSILGMPFLKWSKRMLIWIGGHSTNMWLIHSFFIYQWCQGIIFKPKYDILIYLFFVTVCILGSILINCFWKLVIKLFAKIAKLKIWQFQVIEEP